MYPSLMIGGCCCCCINPGGAPIGDWPVIWLGDDCQDEAVAGDFPGEVSSFRDCGAES